MLKRTGLLLALLVGVILLAGQTAHAVIAMPGTIDDFQTGTLAKWTLGTGAAIAANAGPAGAGDYAVAITAGDWTDAMWIPLPGIAGNYSTNYILQLDMKSLNTSSSKEVAVRIDRWWGLSPQQIDTVFTQNGALLGDGAWHTVQIPFSTGPGPSGNNNTLGIEIFGFGGSGTRNMLIDNIKVIPFGKTVTIGNGSGDLIYPTAQTTLNLLPGDTLYIAAGTYASLQLSQITGTAAAPITVKADPNCVFSTTNVHTNQVRDLAFVVFDGLKYVNYAGNAMYIQGASHDLTFQNCVSNNGGTYWIYDSTKVFNGTKASAFYNFKWQNCTFYAATITNDDWQPVSNLISVLLDFEIANCTFAHYTYTSFPVVPVSMNKAFNLQVHDCSFSDEGVLDAPVGHGVSIGIQGYGKFHHNRFTTNWADDVRSFPMKLNALGYNGADAVNRYYNNLSYEKRKYAAFEHNSIPDAQISGSQGYFSKTSAEVYFNTMYRSRKVDYVAPLVDIYAPNITIKYNLIVEPECDAAWNPSFYRAPRDPFTTARCYTYSVGTDLGLTPNVVVDYNFIYQTLAASGLESATTFNPSATSPVKDACGGGTVSYITDDFYHHNRYVGSSADAGAVERP